MKRFRPPYLDRLDAMIRAGLERGESRTTISSVLRVSWHFVAGRIAALGLSEIADHNAREASKRAHESRKRLYAVFAALAEAEMRRANEPLPRPAHIPASSTVRGIRYHAPTGSACIDPDHVVACLHARGVTLPDIEDHLGIPQVAAVDAIRRHAEVRLP